MQHIEWHHLRVILFVTITFCVTYIPCEVLSLSHWIQPYTFRPQSSNLPGPWISLLQSLPRKNHNWVQILSVHAWRHRLCAPHTGGDLTDKKYLGSTLKSNIIRLDLPSSWAMVTCVRSSRLSFVTNATLALSYKALVGHRDVFTEHGGDWPGQHSDLDFL